MKVVDGFKLICQNLGIPMFVVYWSETALEFCTGGDIRKNIYIIKPDGRVEIKPYTKTEVKTLLEKGYFGYDLTYNEDIPKEALLMPREHIILGKIQLKKVRG
ncbi:MAG TPA: hypothetical protein ENG45_00980 [Candidatus Aenigmarchaeota archaeon]|nr:hypothetical protein [Candidatus Aenigmarchaeota archaeon]